jgi:hypothetical protein
MHFPELIQFLRIIFLGMRHFFVPAAARGAAGRRSPRARAPRKREVPEPPLCRSAALCIPDRATNKP